MGWVVLVPDYISIGVLIDEFGAPPPALAGPLYRVGRSGLDSAGETVNVRRNPPRFFGEEFDIADDILERAANVGQAYTLAYCTYPWYHCPSPQ